MPDTKLRSNLVSGCFLSYGIGCIVINIVTIWVDDCDVLVNIAAFLVVITIIPSFFSFYETPQFLYHTGRFNDLVRCLWKIGRYNRRGLTQEEIGSFLIGDDHWQNVKNRIIKVLPIGGNKETGKKAQSAFLLLLTDRK